MNEANNSHSVNSGNVSGNSARHLPAVVDDDDDELMRPVTPPPKHRFNSVRRRAPPRPTHIHTLQPSITAKPAHSTSTYLPALAGL